MSKTFDDIIFSAVDRFLDNQDESFNLEKFSAKLFINSSELPEEKEKSIYYIYGKNFSIHCILNIPKEAIVKVPANQPVDLTVTQSTLDILIYKSNSDNSSHDETTKTNNSIKILLVIIINSFENPKEEEGLDNRTLININNIEEVNLKLKKFIFNYLKGEIKKNEYYSFPHWILASNNFIHNSMPFSNYAIENILLGYESINGVYRLFHRNNLITSENFYQVKKFDNYISSVEIIPSKVENTFFSNENNIKKTFLNTFIIHSKIEYIYEMKKELLNE